MMRINKPSPGLDRIRIVLRWRPCPNLQHLRQTQVHLPKEHFLFNTAAFRIKARSLAYFIAYLTLQLIAQLYFQYV